MAHRRGFAVVLALVSSAAVFSAVPATADPPEFAPSALAGASGNVGMAHGMLNGQAFNIATLAACDAAGVRNAFTPGASAPGVARFGWGWSSCNRDFWGTSSAQVQGSLFSLDALRQWNGPAIRLSSFSVACSAGRWGTSTNFQVAGMFGVRIPSRVPPNYTVFIPSRIPGAAAVAKVVVNEVTHPAPGTVRLNLFHIWLFPFGSGGDTGELVIGSVACSPRLT